MTSEYAAIKVSEIKSDKEIMSKMTPIQAFILCYVIMGNPFDKRVVPQNLAGFATIDYLKRMVKERFIQKVSPKSRQTVWHNVKRLLEWDFIEKVSINHRVIFLKPDWKRLFKFFAYPESIDDDILESERYNLFVQKYLNNKFFRLLILHPDFCKPSKTDDSWVIDERVERTQTPFWRFQSYMHMSHMFYIWNNSTCKTDLTNLFEKNPDKPKSFVNNFYLTHKDLQYKHFIKDFKMMIKDKRNEEACITILLELFGSPGQSLSSPKKYDLIEDFIKFLTKKDFKKEQSKYEKFIAIPEVKQIGEELNEKLKKGYLTQEEYCNINKRLEPFREKNV